MLQDKVEDVLQENGYHRLDALETWLNDHGIRRSWFAGQIGYKPKSIWYVLAGRSTLTDGFVLACFNRFPELPFDIFEAHGYVRGDGCVYKQIPLAE